MNKDQTDLITALVNEEHPRDYIKRELISQGLSTEGFEEGYQDVLTELHRTEPKTEKKPVPVFLQEEHSPRTNSHRSAYAALKWLLRAAVLAAVCSLLVWAAMQFAPQIASTAANSIHLSKSQNEDLSVGDAVLRSKVETTAASMRLYGSRMGSFDGACKDVVIIAPIECLQNSGGYAVYAPLGNGQLYCIDSKGFRGDTGGISSQGISCQN